MSFTKTVVVEMEDAHIPFLRSACDSMELVFGQDQKTFQTHEGKRACEHAISQPGTHHEIGLVRNRESGTLDFSVDFYNSPRLREAVGNDFEILTQRISTEMARESLYDNGAREVREEWIPEENVVRLHATY